MWTQPVASIVSQLGGGSIELTLMGLAEALCQGGELRKLEKIKKVCEFLESFGLELIPDMSIGELESKRLLRFRQRQGTASAESFQALVNQGESEVREFKSSLLFDHKRAQKQQGVNPRECRSDEVLLSTLKTIAAFLNSEGGTLIVGVADDGTVLGLEYDFQLHETPNADKWELHLRNTIKSRFLDGGTINDYVRITTLEVSGKRVAQLEVLPRPDISFVIREGREYCLFRRQGNLTTEVQITEFEEFLLARDRRRNALRSPVGSAPGVLTPK